LNIVFLIEDSQMNIKHTISFISDRLKSSLQVENVEKLKEDNKYGIYKFLRLDKEDLYLECYRIKNYNIYLVNIINIDEVEKNNIIELISSDKLFKNNIILIDSLSNHFISEEYNNFLLLETHLKQYYALKLLYKYNTEAYKIIDNIKTKEDLVILPSNIKTNLQKIELVVLIDNIIDKPLGGLEYETYFEKYDKDDLNPLKLAIKEEIFDDIKNDLQDSKGIIKEYRNVICHNRFLNCSRLEESHCRKVELLKNKLIECNNSILNTIYGTDELTYYNSEVLPNNERFTFALKKEVDQKNSKLLLISILLKLNIIYDKEMIVCDLEEEGLLIYESENDGIFISIKKLEKNDKVDSELYIITIKFDLESAEKRNLNGIILKQFNQGEIILLYDSLSMEKSKELSAEFTVLENLFREYITLFQYIGKIKENNEKDKMPQKLRIGISGNSLNSIYDLDFIDLLPIISTPNGGNNIQDLRQRLGKAINDNDIDNIEFLLNNMLDYNNDLKIIVKHWCELYRYRTLVAHCGILLENEYKNILSLVKSTRLTVENILVDYLYKNASIFNYEDKIELTPNLKIYKNNINSKYCDIDFIRDSEDGKCVTKIENLYLFRIVQIIVKLLDKNKYNFQHVFSYEYLNQIIIQNKDELINIIKNQDFESKLALALEKLGFYEYADFRVITSQEQLLEEKIGDLLNSIHSKMAQINREKEDL